MSSVLKGLKLIAANSALRSFRGSVLLELARDAKAGYAMRAGRLQSRSGMAHAEENLDASLRYIEEVFGDYKSVGGIDEFAGRAAELGPGDNYGVALLLRSSGCRQVDLVDRFHARRNPAYQALIYAELARRHPPVAALLEGVDLNDDRSFPGVRVFDGPAAAAERFFTNERGYDFILSRAVLEHLYDPELALGHMVSALKPGGMLLHKVDLRDHRLFSTRYHELKWLEPAVFLHRRMTRNRGRPNRVLIHRYRAALDALGLDYELLVTSLAGVGEIVPHVPYSAIDQRRRDAAEAFVRENRRRFSTDLRGVADDDLAVTGFFMVARSQGAKVP